MRAWSSKLWKRVESSSIEGLSILGRICNPLRSAFMLFPVLTSPQTIFLSFTFFICSNLRIVQIIPKFLPLLSQITIIILTSSRIHPLPHTHTHTHSDALIRSHILTHSTPKNSKALESEEQKLVAAAVELGANPVSDESTLNNYVGQNINSTNLGAHSETFAY